MSVNKHKEKKSSKVPVEITSNQLWNNERMNKISSYISPISEKRTYEQRLKTEILSIKYKIHMYLDSEDVENKLQILDFVKLYLKALRITQSDFATKIGMKEGNLHKYFTSKRKLNPDIVMKLSCFSHTKPELWYSIQTKNALLELRKEKEKMKEYRKYDYEKLSKSLHKHKVLENVA